MSAVLDTKRISLVHIREIDQLLAHGQTNSHAALIDLASGAVLSRGGSEATSQSIDDKMVANLGQTLLVPERASASKREHVRILCERLGGVSEIVILMRESCLFLGRLPDSSIVLSLVVRHGDTSASASESVVHARAIHSRCATRKATDIEAEVEEKVSRSYSIWNSLIAIVTNRFATSASGSMSDAAVRRGLLRQAAAENDLVVAGDLYNFTSGAHLDHFRHPRFEALKTLDTRGITATLSDLFGGKIDLRLILKHFGFAEAAYGKVQVRVGDRDFYWLRVPFFPAMHIPFDSDAALLLYKKPRPNPALDWTALDHVGLNLLRLRIGSLLVGGMKTQMSPFPQNQIEFQDIVNRLAGLPKADLVGRLDIGGFAAHPVEIDEVTQRCQECIYYLPHRKWCDLPELPVPVEAGWWCRLWKV